MSVLTTKKREDQLDIATEIRARRKALNKRSIKTEPTVKWLPPTPISKEYQRILENYVEEMVQVTIETVIVFLPSLAQERNEEFPAALQNDSLWEKAKRIFKRNDNFEESTARVLETMRLGIAAIPFNKALVAEDIGQKTSQWNNRQWQKTIRNVLGVPLFQQEPWLGPVLNSFTLENVALITKMEADYMTDVSRVVQEGMRQGQSSRTIARELLNDPGLLSGLGIEPPDRRLTTVGLAQKYKSRARLIARDQVSKLNGQLTMLRQSNLGITKYRWQTAEDERVRHTHAILNNTVQTWDDPPSIGNPGQPIQCFPGYNTVSSLQGAIKLFRRSYTGKLAFIRTRTSNFNCTPNHPILTSRGWVPANEIKVGDDLIHVFKQAFDFCDRDIHKLNPHFEKIFDFLSLAFDVENVPGLGSQFHGDGSDEEVDIINMQPFLESEWDSSRVEEILKWFFPRSDTLAIFELAYSRDIYFMLQTIFGSSNSFIRPASYLLSFFQSSFAESYDISLRAVSYLNVILSQNSLNGTTAETAFFGNRQYTESTFIELNNLIVQKIYLVLWRASMIQNSDTPSAEFLGQNIRMDSDNTAQLTEGDPSFIVDVYRVTDVGIEDFTGHVYNAETVSNHYNIANFTVHNCRCHGSPIFDDIVEEILTDG